MKNKFFHPCIKYPQNLSQLFDMHNVSIVFFLKIFIFHKRFPSCKIHACFYTHKDEHENLPYVSGEITYVSMFKNKKNRHYNMTFFMFCYSISVVEKIIHTTELNHQTVGLCDIPTYLMRISHYMYEKGASRMSLHLSRCAVLPHNA